MAAVFVDTTTLLYTLDPQDPQKQAVATAWLRRLRLSRQIVLSPQVLNECYAVVRRKAAFAAARPMVRAYLSDHARWATAPVGPETTEQAWRLEDQYGLAWWDALLLASAGQAGCRLFLTEDLNDGQLYGDVRVIDPFRHTPEAAMAEV